VEIIEKLRQLSLIGSIVVMPDFFVDRIIRLESKENLFDTLTEKAGASPQRMSRVEMLLM
jgi:hypothetical protein